MVSTRTLFTSALLLLSSAISTATPTSSNTTSISSTATATSTTSVTVPTCQPEHEGIIYPIAGSTITLIKNDNLDPTYVEIVYCSGAYFKITSIEASVLLSFPNSVAMSGQVLVKDAPPDDFDSEAGFSSYRFNASIYPLDGDYYQGPMAIGIFETTTGE
jgi:hypothetical protein